MAETYKRLYGVDWPKGMSDDNIRLTIGKKWREYKAECGIEFRDPWVPMLDAARHLFGDYLKVSPWTEQHFHDWVMEPMLVTIGCASSGKMLLLDEPLMFPDHKGTMREVRVGDLVMAATGNPVRVTGVYDHVDKPLFTVRFCDGTETVCGGEHLWTVRYWGRVERGSPVRGTRDRYGWVNEVVTTDRIASWKPAQVRRRRLQVPLTHPVDYTETRVPVEPYVLGCLLGDGSVTQTLLLSSHVDDREVRDEFQRGLEASHPGYVLKRVGKSTTTYMVVKSDASKGPNVVVSALKSLGVYGTDSLSKFIPDAYLHNSRRVRERVLAGLLDTDGYVDRQGHISFSTVSERLASGVRELFESLGAWVTVSEKTPGFTSGGVRRTGQRAFTVFAHGIRFDEACRLFRLSRKRSRLRPGVRGEGWKAVVSVSPVADRSSYPRETRCITLADRDECGNPVHGVFPIGHYTVTHNSNDTGALIVLDWIVDPFDTVTLLGSTTKDALRLRSWESVERYFKILKNLDAPVPGKYVPTGYVILNEKDVTDDPMAQGAKAGIHGVALNDGGKLQGAHLPYVRLVIDELATIYNHEDIKTTVENLQIAKDFKFVGLANPEAWSNPSCQYMVPEGGVSSVTVDTGSWRSTYGCFVRHHDGMKSPCVLHPELAAEFPFLTQRRHIDLALKRAEGNPTSPQFWKMVRGFPLSTGNDGQVVLDAAVAVRNRAADPAPPFDPVTWYATVAGVDPAWSEGGDNACYARCYVRRDAWGKPYLDFTNGLRRMTLDATRFNVCPAVEQQRRQVLGFMREPYAATFRNTAVDSSGNQALADELIIYNGAVDIMAVNFAVRASEQPMRAYDDKKTKDNVYDRGTEAWCVLAEFVRAGQVRGLPQEVVDALTTRRFAARMVRDATGLKVPAGAMHPLRLEKKEDYKARHHDKSPDECDACALAALAAKERLGLLPYSYVVRLPSQEARVDPAGGLPVAQLAGAPQDDYGRQAVDGDEVFDGGL